MDDQPGLHGATHEVTDPMRVMRRVVEQALALIPLAEGAVVELANDETLTYVSAAGNLVTAVGTQLGLHDSLSGLAIRTGQTLRCDDSEADSRVDRGACRRVGARAMVCVPLRRAGQVVGVLKVSASHPAAFNDADVVTLTKLAGFITAAIAGASELALAADVLDAAGGDAVGEFVAHVLRPGLVGDVETRRRIVRVLSNAVFTVVCQPIVDLHTGSVVGAEALARFPAPPNQPPDAWFADAAQVGLGVPLELAAFRKALKLIPRLPDSCYLALNVSPHAITAPELPVLIEAAGGHRVVVELTEHVRVEDYPRLRRTLAELRQLSARLAIDDTGAGFASMAHILQLAPDVIKLDRDLTAGVDVDPVRRALAGALVSFAADTGAEVLAEGIETADEARVLRELGIRYGQGYYLGRPGPVESLPLTVDTA
jgi:EAL domain-containing protein (putative c-di-GMP-specific phosphodiesterase class I)